MIETWPFVGRDRELAGLEERIAASRDVLLLGPSGIGKTAILHALVSRMEAAGRELRVLPTDGRTVGYALHTLLEETSDPRGRGKVVVIVDDVHDLDPALLDELFAPVGDNGRCVVVADRGLDQVPEPLARHWRDGSIERVELGGLDRAAVELVLEAVLGGQVDEAVVTTLATRAEGNGLLLREMVLAAHEAGRFVRRGSLWQLDGELPVSEGVRDLVILRLGSLSAALSDAFEVIAIGEPLPLGVAEAMVDGEDLEHLESAGWITLRETVAGDVVVATHPLYAEIVRADLPRLRRRRLQLSLARALETAVPPRPPDMVRAAIWRLDAGDPGDPARLFVAARHALSLSGRLAERIARHLVANAPSLPASLLLADILVLRNKAEEAADVLNALPTDRLGPADREAVAHSLVISQGLLGTDPAAGAALVAAALNGDLASSRRLRAMHAAMLSFSGRSSEALQAAAPLLPPETGGRGWVGAVGDDEVWSLAALAAVASHYWSGSYRAARDVAERCLEPARRVRPTLPYVPSSIEVMAVCAMLESGDFDAAHRATEDMALRADADHDVFAWPRSRYLRGRVALARGRPRSAVRHLRLAAHGMQEFDVISLAHVRSVLARAAAAAGFLDEAVDALVLPDEVPSVLGVYEAEWHLAEAGLAAARGCTTQAVERALWVAEASAGSRQWGMSLVAAHDAARWGDPGSALSPLRAAAGLVDGPLARILLEHGLALAAVDAEALDEVGTTFEAVGALLHAAEAPPESAEAHRRAGRPRAAIASARAAGLLLARTESAWCPWLAGTTGAVPLTPRERQVAGLALHSTDHEISVALGVSVRTVETHLARAYVKLGVHSRVELESALHDASP